MILPNLLLPSRANQCWQESGIDSFERCIDRSHFLQYPHEIEYQYNSRGFRDAEWPKRLENLIWCVGDSFTTGIGSPYSHIWPQVLGQKSSIGTINVSMDGASNNWIARRAVDIINEFTPTNIVILWSYVERCELSSEEIIPPQWKIFYSAVKDPSWPQCDDYRDFQNLPLAIRQELQNHYCGNYIYITDDCSSIEMTGLADELRSNNQNLRLTDQEDLDNFKQCESSVSELKSKTNIIQAFIPKFSKPELAKKYISLCENNCIGPIPRLDIARDGHHFDIKTSQWFTEKVIPFLK